MNRLSAIFFLSISLFSTNASADLISSVSGDGPGLDLQSLFNDWVGPSYDLHANHSSPDQWMIGATGQSSSTLILEIAGNAGQNTFGLYDVYDPNNRLLVYDGAAGSNARRGINYSAATNTFTVGNTDTWSLVDSAVFTSNLFGFYLEGPGGTFFSDDALNGNQTQMVAFQGTGVSANFLGTGYATWLSNEWVLAWEDLAYSNSDMDFNDLVMIIESVTPVAEPGSLGMLAMGILGLLVLRRRTDSRISTGT